MGIDHAGFVIVTFDLFEEPGDRVKGVCPLDENAFAQVTAADVLVDEEFIRPRVRTILVLPVGSHTVRRPAGQKRICLQGVFRHLNASEEPLAVTHRNPVFVMRLIGLHILGQGCRRHRLR